MSLPVHLIAPQGALRPGDPVAFDGDEAHHAVAVRRVRVGEHLQLTDGAGLRVIAEVAETGKRHVAARVLEVESVPEPSPELVVVQAVPKGERGELAVEMLTEIGAARVVPWAAERCVAQWRGERAIKGAAKWRARAGEAAKQSRRSWFPVVDELSSTADVAELIAAADLALVLHEDATEPLAAVEVGEARRIVLVVGPEGGIGEAELARLTDAGARSVRLGAEVLRTSTAGVAACAALLSRGSRWA